MKRSAAVRLTLVSTLAAAACGPERPRQELSAYCDPARPEVCEQTQRPGYVATYHPMYHGGVYYDRFGVARTGPGGAEVAGAPRPVASRPGVARGGFGGIGSGRSVRA